MTNANLLSSVTDFNGNQISINDTADGLPASQVLGSTGDTLTNSYDGGDSPSSITLANSSATLQSFSYANAPSGNILTETDTPSTSASPASYGYDAQGRVTSMTPGSGSQLNYGFDASANLTGLPTGATGTYDHAGELTSSTLSGNTTNYSYDADGGQLAAVSSGNSLSSGTWNGAEQLASYADGAASMTTATYDGNGIRASSTATTVGGSAVTQGYVWDTVPQVPRLLMDTSNAYIYSASGAPAEQVSLATGAVTYLIADSLGSVRGVVDSSGSLTATASYDAWGNPETVGGLTAATPFGYAGGYTDPTGLVYLLYRYYSPAEGQFVSVDPDLRQTQQPYQYADSDPVSNADPTGQFSNVWAYCDLGKDSWTGWCQFWLDYFASHAVIHTLAWMGAVGDGCERLADLIPKVGDYLRLFCPFLGETAAHLAHYLYERWEECHINLLTGLSFYFKLARFRYWLFTWRWSRWLPYYVHIDCWVYPL